MFTGNNSNNVGNGIENKVNVNTHLFTSYSDNCLVSLGFWNDKISLKFQPCIGVNANGLRQYSQDKNMIVQTSLLLENATTFLEMVDKEFEPKFNEKKAASVSIIIGADANKKILTLSTDGNDVFLSIAVNVDSSNKADSNNVMVHQFQKKDSIVNYNNETGAGEIVKVDADYKNFIKKLRDIYTNTPAIPHSINYSNAIKSSYSNRNNGGMSEAGSNYSAPESTYTGDMSDFLQ